MFLIIISILLIISFLLALRSLKVELSKPDHFVNGKRELKHGEALDV